MWVSLNIVSRHLFEFNINIFHQYKDHFFKVMPISSHINEPGWLYGRDGEARFPFYWQSHPAKFKSFNEHLMSPVEKANAIVFGQLPTSLNGKAILALPSERDPHRALDSKT